MIHKWESFLYENKYDIDIILDKISKNGLKDLSFYEKEVLKNPNIQKRLIYEYEMSLIDVKNLLNNFNIDYNKEIYIDETFFIDGEIKIGDYDEDKFNDIMTQIGDENFIRFNEYDKKFRNGRIEYTNKIINKINFYPIAINFFKSRTEFVFYNKKEDLIIEISPLEKEYKFSSEKEIDKYINILKKTLKDREIIENIEIYFSEYF